MGATKKRHTEHYREVRYIGPPEKIQKVAEVARSLDLKDLSETIEWRDLFPGYDHDSSPFIALRGSRKKENLTQKELARLTGIPQGHISEMETGKRSIGKEIARKLGEALNVNYRIFL